MNNFHIRAVSISLFVAEGVVAEEAHDADFAVETLYDVLGPRAADAQGLGHRRT
jgi:hypothetical protein